MAKILLVEDDKSLREIYGVRLMAEGYEIVSAGDGEEALAMAIKERPDLIVSDVMMPKISGFDMLDILRSTTETKDVKVIMMTALSSDDQRARGESLGADRYLVKSQVGIEDVVRTVHDVLGDSIAPAAAPTFPPAAPAAQAPVAAPEPVAQAAPEPVVAAPAPAPAPEPIIAPAPQPVAAPAPAVEPFVAPTPAPEPAVSAYAAPVTPEPIAAPTPAPVAPEPIVAPAPAAPATPIFTPPVAPVIEPVLAAAAPLPAAAPAPASTVLSELPPSPAPLPQPTAPFSTPAPASLGDRVIQPLSDPTESLNHDIASQMEQALNSPGVATPPSQGPLPPAV